MLNKFIVILFLQWLNENKAAPQDINKQIKDLETEKKELYKQINDAIEDSVTSLQKANSSDAQLGISYIQDLKKQIKDLNGAEDDKISEKEDVNFDDKSDLETRRVLNNINDVQLLKIGQSDDALERRTFLKEIANVEKKKAKLELAYFAAMKDKSKKWRQRYEARLRIQNKLDAWIEKREREKQKIKERQQKLMIFNEKCPRFGRDQGKAKKKKKSKRGGTPKKTGKSYPCCRKCCKKSYMGCLKKK